MSRKGSSVKRDGAGADRNLIAESQYSDSQAEYDPSCGIGPCKPRGLRACANMRVYAVIMAFIILFHIALFR